MEGMVITKRTFLGIVLALSGFVFPIGRFLMPLWETSLWDVLTWAVFLAVFVTIYAIPWVRNRWTRQLRAELKLADPEGIVVSVRVVSLDTGSESFGVLGVNAVGMRLYRSEDLFDDLTWDDIERVSIVQFGTMARELLEVVNSHESQRWQLIPAHADGSNRSPLFLSKLLASILAKRQMRDSEPKTQ